MLHSSFCFRLTPLALLSVLAISSALGCAASPSPPAASADAAHHGDTCHPGADESLAKLSDEDLARKLLDVMGSGQLAQQVSDSMLESFRKMPNLPPGFIDRFKKNIQMETLTNIVVGVYLKHLDRTEMIAAIDFYTSEQGRRIVASLPVVTAETMGAAKVWGSDLAKKTLTEMGVPTP